MKPKTILIAAGGTGGHLYPAIAVAEELKRIHPEIRIIFVGTRDRIESREVPRAGYPFYPLAIEAPGNSLKSLLLFPGKLAKAILDCIKLISRERPAAMLGGGAYLSIPAGIAAWALHVPIALLEINSVAGTANKLLARLADKLFIAYPESRESFPKRVAGSATVSGTPVRADLGSERISQTEARNAFGLDPERTTVLVFGGSLGARAINEAMQTIAADVVAHGCNVLWQTGKSANVSELIAEFVNIPNVRVLEYIYEMETAYRSADLVVCRAGASSLAELARLGKPAVLIPYPHAAANHQETNAAAFERDGAAILLRDPELKEKLKPTILELIQNEERLHAMSGAIRRRDNPNAARLVAEWLVGEK
jgi:UDP-N-acetylglucosamine--N-acetylmuramyl-(pentapeptide) pyrophosphoryl-undecaprenol N-acetylglucosamine transferase